MLFWVLVFGLDLFLCLFGFVVLVDGFVVCLFVWVGWVFIVCFG